MIGPHSWLPADRRAAYWRAYSISLFSAFTTGSLLYLFGFNEKEAIITSCGVSVAVFLTLIFLYQQETTSNTVLLAVSQWTRTRKSSFAFAAVGFALVAALAVRQSWLRTMDSHTPLPMVTAVSPRPTSPNVFSGRPPLSKTLFVDVSVGDLPEQEVSIEILQPKDNVVWRGYGLIYRRILHAEFLKLPQGDHYLLRVYSAPEKTGDKRDLLKEFILKVKDEDL
jgi:hypothetical protein